MGNFLMFTLILFGTANAFAEQNSLNKYCKILEENLPSMKIVENHFGTYQASYEATVTKLNSYTYALNGAKESSVFYLLNKEGDDENCILKFKNGTTNELMDFSIEMQVFTFKSENGTTMTFSVKPLSLSK
ncbi:MAG: hypothetical protein ACXVCY_07865 [Pseudobdellovibrionaceae bacterium]